MIIPNVDVDDASCEIEKKHHQVDPFHLAYNVVYPKYELLPDAAVVVKSCGPKSARKKRPPFFCALLVLVQRFPIPYFHPG